MANAVKHTEMLEKLNAEYNMLASDYDRSMKSMFHHSCVPSEDDAANRLKWKARMNELVKLIRKYEKLQYRARCAA